MHYVLAILCPPLAVLFTGRIGAAILNFFLSLLWLPGAIHACILVRAHNEELETGPERFSPNGAQRSRGVPTAVINTVAALLLLLYLNGTAYLGFKAAQLLRAPEIQMALKGGDSPLPDAALQEAPTGKVDIQTVLKSAQASLANQDEAAAKQTLLQLITMVQDLQKAQEAARSSKDLGDDAEDPSLAAKESDSGAETENNTKQPAPSPLATSSATQDPRATRTWTDVNGRTMEAKMVNATTELIVLDVPGRGYRTWPRTAFSPADNALADRFIEERASGVQYTPVPPSALQASTTSAPAARVETASLDTPNAPPAPGSPNAKPEPAVKVGIKRDFVQLSPDGSLLHVKDHLRLIHKKAYRSISWGPLEKQEDGNFKIQHTYRGRGYPGYRMYDQVFTIDSRGTVLRGE